MKDFEIVKILFNLEVKEIRVFDPEFFFFLHFRIQYRYDYTLRKNKNQDMCLGAFVYFHGGFFGDS